MEKIFIPFHYLFLAVLTQLLCLSSFANIPDLDWYEIANQDGISIQTTDTADDIIPFKARGTINAKVERVLEILMEHENKNLWSPKLKFVKIHKELGGDEFIFSEYYSTPWPATDREFLLKGKLSQLADKKYSLKAHSLSPKGENAKRLRDIGHIQANVRYLNVFIEEVAPGKTEIQFEFHGDMKGWMPVWLMNLIQKKWPLRFIQGLRKQI
jgi:hypothetical protein